MNRSLRIALLAIALTAATALHPASATDFYHPVKVSLTEPPPDEEDVATGTDDLNVRLVTHGMDYLGVRYRRGGSNPETGLDCSGLVQNVFSTSVGLQLPRTAADMARLGTHVERNELMPGDLVFFKTSRRAFSHVGIYVGDGRMLHAPSSGGVVRIEDIGKRYWKTRFNGARRLLARGAS